MPIEPARRESDLETALCRMVAEQGDQPRMPFSPDDSFLRELAPTTWDELLAEGFIESRGTRPYPTFRLTASGWLKGMRLNGALDRPDVRDRAVTIRRALKGRVKSRHLPYDAFEDVRSLATEIGLPVGWVSSALSANLLAEMFPDDMMNASLDGVKIRIPRTFDMARR